ncbi:hypothetical protein PR202_gb23458 [Eleusine coracana subsp. coracana]|uniref:Exonuclease domain-containing protein n=1 Tax=Eleusine coracana subsp. coracana TaxID=191504 RepID=A0AAV5FJ64_ELECO|nr:hypothetical protein PR202_gb23458 [Eleusine coracana subsp. coracana]
MAVARVSSSCLPRLLSSPLLHSFLRHFYSSIPTVRRPHQRSFPIAAALSEASPSPHAVMEGGAMEAPRSGPRRTWKPTCLYYTQGKCTMMDDTLHLEKFNHNLMLDLPVNTAATDKVKDQKLDYFLILDLEGKVEILEFPVVMIDAQSMEFIDSFHRYSLLVSRDFLQEFEDWMGNHNLWSKEQGGSLNSAAFVTCGNWDLKTKVPEQCRVSKIKLPTYFMEWINLKDIYLNFYNRRATGMMTMMRQLEMPIAGSHHLGIDDSKNIARVVQRLLADGAVIQMTAKRQSATSDVKFLFKNRIR